MDALSEELMKELNCKMIEFPFFGGISIPESVLITWAIILAILILCLIFVRDLKMEPISKRQIAIETIVEGLNNFFEGILGDEGKRFIPLLEAMVIYIGFANIMGVFGLTPPTKDLNVTAGLAITSILLIEYAALSSKGIKGFFKSFAQPMAIVAPINILEIFVRPLSLCMRLFGNVLGSFVVMELLKLVVPVFIPAIFSFYFDIFDGFIQAYVFVFLTSLFIKEAIE